MKDVFKFVGDEAELTLNQNTPGDWQAELRNPVVIPWNDATLCGVYCDRADGEIFTLPIVAIVFGQTTKNGSVSFISCPLVMETNGTLRPMQWRGFCGVRRVGEVAVNG